MKTLDLQHKVRKSNNASHSQQSSSKHFPVTNAFLLILILVLMNHHSVVALSLMKRGVDFIPLSLTTPLPLDHAVFASKPLYFELVLPMNETYQGFSISILCGTVGCGKAITTLNVSTDPVAIVNGSPMWTYNESAAFPGITISPFSSPPFKNGAAYYIAYGSSMDIDTASVVCQSFSSGKLMINPKETILTARNFENSASTLEKHTVFVPLAHRVTEDQQELDHLYRLQQEAFPLFKKSVGYAAKRIFNFHSKVIQPSFYHDTRLKAKHMQYCTQDLTYKIYQYEPTNGSPLRLLPRHDQTQQSTDSLLKFFKQNEGSMKLLYRSDDGRSGEFCSVIDNLPFGVIDMNFEKTEKRPVLFLTVSLKNGETEYVHYPIEVTAEESTLLDRAITKLSLMALEVDSIFVCSATIMMTLFVILYYYASNRSKQSIISV